MFWGYRPYKPDFGNSEVAFPLLLHSTSFKEGFRNLDPEPD